MLPVPKENFSENGARPVQIPGSSLPIDRNRTRETGLGVLLPCFLRTDRNLLLGRPHVLNAARVN